MMEIDKELMEKMSEFIKELDERLSKRKDREDVLAKFIAGTLLIITDKYTEALGALEWAKSIILDQERKEREKRRVRKLFAFLSGGNDRESMR